MIRLNKYLALCGVASRRNADDIILSGKVKVNDKLVLELGVQVDEDSDVVTVMSKPVQMLEKHTYLMLNKPKGYITTAQDDRGRKTVLDLIKCDARVFPIGRLDRNTEGLLLLTTDGDLANILMHPKNEIGKTYIAKVEGAVSDYNIETLKEGVVIDDQKTGKAIVKILEKKPKFTIVEITIFEGRNRQVRKMFDAIYRRVLELKRIKIGDLELGDLTVGQTRKLTTRELAYLKKL